MSDFARMMEAAIAAGAKPDEENNILAGAPETPETPPDVVPAEPAPPVEPGPPTPSPEPPHRDRETHRESSSRSRS